MIIGCRDLQCNRLLFGVIEVFACFQLQRTVGRYFKTFVAHRVGVRIRCILIRCAQFANGYPHFTFTDTDRIQRDIGRCVIFIGRRNIRHILRITGRFFHSTYIVGVFDVDTDLMSGIVIGKRIGLVGRRRDWFPITQPLVPDTIFRKTVAIADFRCQFTADFGFTVNDYATRLIHRCLTVVIARIQAGTATFPIFGIVVRTDRAAIFQRLAAKGDDTAVFVQADVVAWQISARPLAVVTVNGQRLFIIIIIAISNDQFLDAANCLRCHHHTAILAASCQCRGRRRIIIGDSCFYRFGFVHRPGDTFHANAESTVWLITVVIQRRHSKVMAGLSFRDGDGAGFCLDVVIIGCAMLDSHGDRHIAICRLIERQGVSGTFTFDDIAIATQSQLGLDRLRCASIGISCDGNTITVRSTFTGNSA